MRYTGETARGIVVINELKRRGRRFGADLFERARITLPLELVGISADDYDGVNSLSHQELLTLEARYRFFFNPIRYTSLGLAVCEAMTIGLPIVGLATTEMAQTIENGVSGFVSTNMDEVIENAEVVLQDANEQLLTGLYVSVRTLRQLQ